MNFAQISVFQQTQITNCDLLDKSNILENITETITFPDNLENGEYVVSASLMSLYGASSSPTLTDYNVTISIGDETSEDYVSSW